MSPRLYLLLGIIAGASSALLLFVCAFVSAGLLIHFMIL